MAYFLSHLRAAEASRKRPLSRAATNDYFDSQLINRMMNESISQWDYELQNHLMAPIQLWGCKFSLWFFLGIC